ncbi:dUTP diphosphatase [Gammaproteobacteria bacterium 50_400_T64]|nr:dUTP diphosphatase [Gammaproteobacteria bacterium 50_400_T64]
MKSRLSSMLDLQDAMNSKVNTDWRQQGFPWYRAIWVECAELLDHYGWKWWKHQQPDMEQVKLELVDIWHFGLSQLLLDNADEEALATDLAKVFQTDDATGAGDFRDQLESFTLSTLSTKSFDPRQFVILLNSAELDFDELYTRYVGKNVLNFFRQDNGYQSGTYSKNWGGREDNEHLVELSLELDATDPAFKDTLYSALKARYTELTA